MNAIYVEVIATRGSAPRDAGTAMKVTANRIEGTIGGGALEYKAIEKARDMLNSGERSFEETLPLGPNLGQCCGGAVSLSYGTESKPLDRPAIAAHYLDTNPNYPRHLWLWGAGHVGRAVVKACHRQNFKITWIDNAADRFPEPLPPDVKAVPAADMPLLANHADREADHLIFTYSHDIDFALCAALLTRKVESIGLIGSDTKRARFDKRLRDIGLDPRPIICPIGDKSLGKAPAQIANGVVRALLSVPAKASA